MASPKTSPQAVRSATPGTKGVLVLGMHRSGTSAMTRVLNLLGCALPEDLLGPGDGNAQGHWESQKAVALNDEILASAGSTWEDWGPINADWRASGTRNAMLDRVTAVVEEHAALGPLFVLKDPRLCRLADLWLEGFAQAGVEPLVVLMVRNPENVAASLEQRDLMVPHYAQLLWLRHVLDAEYFSRGTKRVVCRYERLIGDWRGTIANIRTSLALSLPRNTPAIHGQIDAFLDQRLQHHSHDGKRAISELDPTDWLGRAGAILQRWGEAGEDRADHAQLDEIRNEFDRVYTTFAHLLLTSGASGQAGTGSPLRRELEAKLADADSAAENARLALLEIEQEKSSYSIKIEQMEGSLAAARAQADTRAAEIERLESHVHELAESLKAHQSQAAELGAERDRIAAELVEARDLANTIPNFRDREAEVSAELAETTDRLRDAELMIAELTGQLAAAESNRIQRQEELAQLWDRTLAAEKAVSSAQTEAANERDQRVAIEQLLKGAEAELAGMRGQLRSILADAEERAEKTVEEIAELKLMLYEQVAAAAKANEASERRLRERLQQAEQSAVAADWLRKATEEKLAARFDEIATVTKLLADVSKRGDEAAAESLWLSKMAATSQNFPRWWAIMPDGWRRRREHRRYRNAGLFDAQAYLDANPDVGADGMDPVRHYLLHGRTEGRARPGS